MNVKPIGVIGSEGDLGSQLVANILAAGFSVLRCDTKLGAEGARYSELRDSCSFIHITAPLADLDFESRGSEAIIVLHDSVMSTSKKYNEAKFDSKASIVHMLMNESRTVVTAKNTPHSNEVQSHFEALGYTVQTLGITDHDKLMAQSQAPLALLVKAIHIKLLDQYKKGLLTPSGEVLMHTLNERALEWTPETVHSILQNPELPSLLSVMNDAVHEASASNTK